MQMMLAAALTLIAFEVPATDTDRALEREADRLEDRADDVRDRGESRADAIEDADPGMNSDVTDHAADAVRESSEAEAARLEERADEVRDAK
jgi:hypothetical protein